jgi:hypothetical protein
MDGKLLRIGVVALLLTSVAAPAHAEESTPREDEGRQDARLDLVLPRPNQGHFWSVALLSAGALGFDSERPSRRWTPGVGVNVQLGDSVTDWLDLGIAFVYGQTYGDEDDRLAFGRLSLHSQWYLDPHWFARLDIGAGSVAGRDPRDTSHDRGGFSDVWAVGVGRSSFLSPAAQSGGWVLTPVLGVDVIPADGLTAVVTWLGLEMSYWTGLTKDKLHLPVDRAYE